MILPFLRRHISFLFGPLCPACSLLCHSGFFWTKLLYCYETPVASHTAPLCSLIILFAAALLMGPLIFVSLANNKLFSLGLLPCCQFCCSISVRRNECLIMIYCRDQNNLHLNIFFFFQRTDCLRTNSCYITYLIYTGEPTYPVSR